MSVCNAALDIGPKCGLSDSVGCTGRGGGGNGLT